MRNAQTIGTAPLHRDGAGALGILDALREILRASHIVKASDISAMTSRVLRPLGFEVAIFVADYEQRTLRPLAEGGRPPVDAIMIDGSLAGRAFKTATIRAAGSPPQRLWVPIVNGTVRVGVMAVESAAPVMNEDPQVEDELRAIAALLGHLIQAKGGLGDAVEQARRTRPMTVASELLRRLVPPSTFACEQLALAAVLEPSYDVGGDGYDYSVDGSLANITIADALGHGMPAALVCATAVSATRAARRGGESLIGMAGAADEAITAQWDDARFATAVLAEINLDTGPPAVHQRGPPAAGAGSLGSGRRAAGRREANATGATR